MIRYNREWEWMTWTGLRWEQDRGKVAVEACLQQVMQYSYDEAFALRRGDKRLQTALARVSQEAGADGVFKRAARSGEVYTPATEFDTKPELLNTTTGVYNLDTGQLTGPDRDLLLTKITGAGYVENSYEGSVFQKTLHECLPDKDAREYFQRVMGSALNGRIRDHKLFILVGRGRNAKSLLMEAITGALSSYAGSTENSLLMQSSRPNEMKAQDYSNLADLKGLRLAVAHELPHGVRLDQAFVKRLTGGDQLKAKLMGKDFFEFTPSHTITLLTNDLPVIDVNDPTIWTRLSIIEFTESFEGREDMDLPMKLSTDKERQAVLDWLIQGWHSYQQHRLKEPESVKKARTEYELDSDQLQRFIEEFTEVGDGYSTPARVFARAVNESLQPGDKYLSEREIKNQMIKKEFVCKRVGGGQRWLRIRLIGRITDQDAA
ncbi:MULTISPECIES: phage/plasmid primase, P4 family [Micrococcaceae]|uniref:DNA primase family protein n=1 Tax=Micrococcaceae TaxID=1268 RepID=UPI00210D0618|nr:MULTISPECIES: phage/plasmid primase, P4 family [Micrococcaceae]